MSTLVLTFIGDDRAGLVASLAEIVTEHGANWEESRLAELAGKFAGVVVVSVSEDKVEHFRAALGALEGSLAIEVHEGTAPAPADDARRVTVEILGQDRPGIVRAVSAVFARHDVSVEELATDTRDAPMAGGRLFDATALLVLPEGLDLAALRDDLEAIASEVLVDVTFEGPSTASA